MRARTIGILAAAIGIGLASGPAQATTPPPPVADLHAAAVYDHTAVLKFLVPAAFYDPGAVGVVRLTLGRTGPATPDSGYPGGYPPLTTRPSFVSRRDLAPSTTYTFGVWVRVGTRYSVPRYVTVTTRRDVTPPAPVTNLRGAPTLAQDLTPGVHLRWAPSSSADAHQVTIVRTTTSWAGRTVVVVAGPAGGGFGYDDGSAALRRDVAYHYYVAAIDTSGHLSPYTRVDVATDLRRVGGTNESAPVSLYDSTDRAVAAPPDFEPDLAGRYFVPSPQHWAMNVAPGRYTACVFLYPDPNSAFPDFGGCLVYPSTGRSILITNYVTDPGAHLAIDATTHDIPTGIDLPVGP